MPARAKSPVILQFSGAYAKNPNRRPVAPPLRRKSPPGAPPVSLNVAESAAWTEIIKTAPDGFLERSDRLHIELLARLIVRCRSTNARTSDFMSLRLALRDAGLAPDVREVFLAKQPSRGHVDTDANPTFASI